MRTDDELPPSRLSNFRYVEDYGWTDKTNAEISHERNTKNNKHKLTDEEKELMQSMTPKEKKRFLKGRK